MSASNEELLNSIKNYQRSFEKCASLCCNQKMVLQEIPRGEENAVETTNHPTCADEYVNCCHEENSDKKVTNHQDVDGPSTKRRKRKSSIDGYITRRQNDFESKGDIYEGKHNKSSKRNEGNECRENEEERHESKKYRHSKNSSDSKSYKKQRSFEIENKKPDYDSSSVKETDKSKLKHKADSKSKTKSKHDSSKYRESKSHSSRSSKHGNIDKDKSKETCRYRKGESRSLKESRKNHNSSRFYQREESSQPSRSSSKQKSSSEIKKDIVKRPKPANSENIIKGVDSNSGTSFTEVLRMCGQRSSKSSSNIKNKSSSLANYEKPRSSPRCITPDNSSVNSSRDSPPKGVLCQDETLSQFVSNKTRTKVCTGKRSPKNAETLLDANINALKHTGGASCLTHKPVLEKATPNQLFNVEHQNPYLIEDTDELWQLRCQKEYRNKKREELESWREMYMRCLNEREERLNAVTAKIKQSQNKPTTIRTTKLAYIDSLPKPSRDNARKQAKNDSTAALYKKPAQTPASRLAALASQADTEKVTDSNPERRVADRPIGKTVATVKTNAPLMAKTLLFMKNRFKR